MLPGNGSTEEQMVVAKYDYKARDQQELDITKNEKLMLLDDSKHWWMVCVSWQRLIIQYILQFLNLRFLWVVEESWKSVRGFMK